MKISIKRLDKELPLPVYSTVGSVGFDLYARVDTKIMSHGIGLVPLNLIVKIPAGFMLMIVSRSSTPKKKGLIIPHGFGVIDQDYCGPEDELKFQVYNPTDREIEVARGERLAQGVFVPILKAEWQEEDGDLGQTRGGFGSTG